MKRFQALGSTALLSLAMMAGAAPTSAQDGAREWCESERGESRRHCEVREFILSLSGSLRVDATPNGGIHVAAWDGDEVQILARVVTRARDLARAHDIADDVVISETGTVSATGPRSEDRESWSVSYRIRVPASYDLDLRSLNGGIDVEGVDGVLALTTTNGGIRLDEVAGDVTARTTNGGMTVVLSGRSWDGAGLNAQTTNGGVTLEIPEGYSAELETGTRNGGINLGFPLTVQGRVGKRITTTLGAGGAPVRVLTTNGGITVRRAN